MSDVAAGIYTYAEFGLVVATFGPIMGVSHLLHRGDPTQRLPGRWMRRLGRTAASLTPLWKFSVKGEAPADIMTRPYVVVSNHESTADPFLLSSLPWDMRWVAKQELFEVPIIGQVFKFSGDIPLRRGEGDSVRQVMDVCKSALAAGIPIMMFPEGTRSKTGELLPFRDGAFRLAIEAGVPVLPLALAGTRDCRPKGSKWFGRANAAVRVLDPLPTKGLGLDDIPRLRDRARSTIEAALPELRASIGARPAPLSVPPAAPLRSSSPLTP